MSANRFTEIFYMYFESTQTSLIFWSFHFNFISFYVCISRIYEETGNKQNTHSLFFFAETVILSGCSSQSSVVCLTPPLPAMCIHASSLCVRVCVFMWDEVYIVYEEKKTRADRTISTWNKNIPSGKNWVWNVFWWGTWMSANPAWQPGYAQGRSKRTTHLPCLTIMQVDCLCDS